MKKLKLIYNPNAGDTRLRHALDALLRVFSWGGYDTHICRAAVPDDIPRQIGGMAAADSPYDALVICGGDGTVNLTVNAMMAHRLDVPLGIIPSGTANDFAAFLKMPRDCGKAAEAIVKGDITRIDLGQVNERYFINVCAAGMFSNISRTIEPNFKNTFGKLAYYIKGAEQMPHFTPMKIKITNARETRRESVHFFLVLNSTGTGGFENLSPGASASDGLLDFIAFRAVPIHELALLFVRVLAGDYLNDPRVLFFRDSQITVEADGPVPDPLLLTTDIDGEIGPDIPIRIRNKHHALRIFTPPR